MAEDLTIGNPTNVQIEVHPEEKQVQLQWQAPESSTGTAMPERYAIFWSCEQCDGGRAVASTTTSITLPFAVIADAGALDGRLFKFGIRSDNDTLHLYSGFASVEVRLGSIPKIAIVPTPSPSASDGSTVTIIVETKTAQIVETLTAIVETTTVIIETPTVTASPTPEPSPTPTPTPEPVVIAPAPQPAPAPVVVAGLIPNNPSQLPVDVPKVPEGNLLTPHIQQDKAGVENGGIAFFGTQSQPQVVNEDGTLTPPAPAPGSEDPIPPDAITIAETFIGQPGGMTFNAPDVAVPVEPIDVNINIPGVGQAAQAVADAYVALANIGNDMSPITRKKAKKILVATIFAGAITRRIK